jgi:hypothetical protein
MIRYDLRCDSGHRFEAWFRDSAAYDAQRVAGSVACAVCGAVKVEKALMAPGIASRGSEPAQPTLSAPRGTDTAAKLAALRDHIEKNAEYVGPRFAAEARRIHAEEGDARAIWGEATASEARALVDDGVPVAPLPWMSRRDD